MKIKQFLIAIVVMLILVAFSKSNILNNKRPSGGYVPNEETAIKIAEAVILPIYGKHVVNNERPFVAELKDSTIWIVHGTLKRGFVGGVKYVEIQKSDGKIINVYGTK